MLRRPRSDNEPATPAPAVEIELIDVTRLECVLDTGLALQFDLGPDDYFQDDETGLRIWLGMRDIKIREPRILYTETRPEQLKRPVRQ